MRIKIEPSWCRCLVSSVSQAASALNARFVARSVGHLRAHANIMADVGNIVYVFILGGLRYKRLPNLSSSTLVALGSRWTFNRLMFGESVASTVATVI